MISPPVHQGLTGVVRALVEQCGLYRTGTLWAHSTFGPDCRPDIITMAKPLANGYPIGAVMMREEIAQAMSVGKHGNLLLKLLTPITLLFQEPTGQLSAVPHWRVRSDTTYCNAYRIGHSSSPSKENSDYLKERLVQMTKWFPNTIQPEIRGRGLILGIGFHDESVPSQVLSLARERGVLVLTAGKDAVRLVPSLNVGKEEVGIAADVLERLSRRCRKLEIGPR
jgi:acetylornithine aminotransferase